MSRRIKGTRRTVTEQWVTVHWSYAACDLDFFATITGLAAHYSQLVQNCMAAAFEGLKKILARKEDDAQLWCEEVLQL